MKSAYAVAKTTFSGAAASSLAASSLAGAASSSLLLPPSTFSALSASFAGSFSSSFFSGSFASSFFSGSFSSSFFESPQWPLSLSSAFPFESTSFDAKGFSGRGGASPITYASLYLTPLNIYQPFTSRNTKLPVRLVNRC